MDSMMKHTHPQDAELPAFDDLPRDEALGLATAWGLLDPALGTLAKRTPEALIEASALVTEGRSIGLTLPLTEPNPPLFGRSPLEHTIFSVDRNTVDDRLDSFFPQASSQWDGLRHIRARERGFFGGVDEEFQPGAGALGIEQWAKVGIVGRGVVLDVARLKASAAGSFDPLGAETITHGDLAEAAESQAVELRSGDVLCIRTGWIDAYRRLDRAGREEMAARPRISGLSGSEEMARYLWDSGVSAVAADNPSLEVSPGDPEVGSLHRRLIPMLGFVVGELLDLEELAAACAEDARWDFLFVAVPLHLPGGVGSPANALALR
jgi:kynurenine formamidase